MGAIQVSQQAAGRFRATGDLRPIPTAIRLESVVRFTRSVAAESVGRGDRTATYPGKSECPVVISRRSIRRQSAKDRSSDGLSVLVHRPRDETPHRSLVAAGGAG